MSTIFSPSACAWKPSNPQGESFWTAQKEKRNKDEDIKRRLQSKARYQPTGASGDAHPSARGRVAQRPVTPSAISNKKKNPFPAIFTRKPRERRQLTDLHGLVFSGMEVFHLPGFLRRSLIAQQEADWRRSVQFAPIMRQLDRDTTAITLRGK